MVQDNKELLLEDLSARLHYGVQILADINKEFDGGVISTLKAINLKKDWVELQSVLTPFKFDEIKPYLRPMSSMTEEEKEEYQHITERWMYDANYSIADSIDWLNTHHFDMRNLIERDLALEAPDGMY